jgi:hypothetical protein
MIKYIYLLFLLFLFGITNAQTVQIDNVIQAPGDITVKVSMLGFTAASNNGSVQSIQLQLAFDSDLLYFKGISSVDPNFAGWVVPANGSSSPITLSYLNMTGHDIDGKMFDLKFGYAGGFNSNISFITGGCEVSRAGVLTPMKNVVYSNGSVTQTASVASVDLGASQKIAVSGLVTIPVNMQGTGLLPFNALTYKIGYDPAKLTFKQIANSVLSGLLAASASNGVVTVTWNGNITSLSTPHVFDLKFTYNGGGDAVLDFKPGSQITNSSLATIPATFVSGLVQNLPGSGKISMPDITSALNSDVSVPITLDYTGSEYVGGINLKIGYNNSILKFTGITPGTLGSGITASALDGVITLVWNKTTNVANLNGVLLQLNFTCISGGSSPLTFNALSAVSLTNLSTVALSYLNGSVTMEQAFINIQPSDQSVIIGGDISFSILASGVTGYQWQVSTDRGVTYLPLTNSVTYSGVTSTTLDITNALSEMNGYLYRVVLQPGNNISGSARLTVYSSITGLSKSVKTGKFYLYPVPSKGTFTASIDWPTSAKFTICVYNSAGRLMFEKKNILVNGNAKPFIDMSSAASGTYTVIFTSGNEQINRKMIITR